MPFADRPDLRYITRGQYQHTRPCVYVAGDRTITIPTGECTDLASTPRFLWWWIPPTGAYEEAAAVHDFGCKDRAAAHRDGRPALLGAREVDVRLFRNILCEADAHAREVGDPFGRIPRARRAVLFYGVRIGALANRARWGTWREWVVDGPVLALAAALLAVAAFYGLRLADRAGHTAAALIGGWL